MIPCPHCGRPVRNGVVACRHCGRTFDALPAVKWAGPDVLIRARAALPADRCAMCGTDEGVNLWPRTFHSAPAHLYLLFLVGILPGLIVLSIYRKTSTLSLPMCHTCSRRWNTGTVILYLIGGGGLLVLPLAGALIFGPLGDWGVAVGAAGGLCVVLVALLVAWLQIPPKVHARVRLIEGPYTMLRFPRPEVTREVLAPSVGGRSAPGR